MRWTLLFACFILAACSQERQSRVDTLRSAPVETTADYSSRTVAPEADVREPIATRSVSAAPSAATHENPPTNSAAPLVAPSAAEAPEISDQEIAQQLIANSTARYPGSCPCPYNTDRAGRRCGGRSAYSRPGGYAPLCYENNITALMIQDYRRKLVTASR
jgi:hypothetical protein